MLKSIISLLLNKYCTVYVVQLKETEETEFITFSEKLAIQIIEFDECYSDMCKDDFYITPFRLWRKF